jgi:predicted aconitase
MVIYTCNPSYMEVQKDCGLRLAWAKVSKILSQKQAKRGGTCLET